MPEKKTAPVTGTPDPPQPDPPEPEPVPGDDEDEEGEGEPSPAPPEPEPVPNTTMYEVLTDTWGSLPPIYHKGDTLIQSMLPPERDLAWAERTGVIMRVPDGDPRLAGAPSGPTGDQTGVPTDGWHSAQMPEALPPELAAQVAQLMAKNGASTAQIAAVTRLAGTPTRVPLPREGQPHVEVSTEVAVA